MGGISQLHPWSVPRVSATGQNGDQRAHKDKRVPALPTFVAHGICAFPNCVAVVDSLWGGTDGLRPSLVATKGGWREGEDLPRLQLGHGSQETHTTCRAWLYL